MRVPLSWLGNHVDVDVSPEALADKLTFAGVEIETVERVGEDLAGIVTARILEVTGHPNADRLVLVRIDAGGDDRSVVCGARNFAPGDVVPWAAPGAKLPGGIEVGRRQVRGEWSDGMLASARELGVFDDHSGILVLPPDTTVGVDLVEAVGLRDAVLDVKSAPNRGDTLSMRGIAREVAVLLGTELKPLDLTVPEAGPAADGLAEIEVEDAEGCPLYVARVVQGLDATRPAPLWMAKRLYLYGMRPLGAVVDVTNYLLLDQGQPLHAFDLDRVPGQRIVVRRAGEGETLRTLDGRDRRLTAADTLITSGEQALALAGIMGGEDSEVRPDTTRVLIESAHFPPAVVRRTMRRLGMSTEGGQRWARGVDPAGAEPVCDQAARLMAQLAGGTVAAGRTVVAVPPSWRFDIELWADLEEEVARRWGYDQVPATLPKATGGRLTDEQRLRRQARGLLAGMGLTEAQTYPFLSQAALDQLGLDPDDPRRRTLRLANPISEEAPELRTTLLPGLAEVARRNLARGRAGVAVYELGAVFLPPEGGPEGSGRDRGLPDEPLTLGLLLAGQRQRGRFDDPTAAFDFADVKGVVEGLVAGLGVDGVGYRAEGPPPYHPGRCAGVFLDQRPVGLLGQLHPRVAADLELPAATFAAELELAPLLAAVPRMRPAATPSPYPELSFDVAFLVPPGVAASDLEAALREAGGELLTRLTLFDAYQGAPLPPGHRNLAYRVALRAAD